MSRPLEVLANSVATPSSLVIRAARNSYSRTKAVPAKLKSSNTLALIFHLGAAALRTLSRFSLGHKLPRLYKT